MKVWARKKEADEAAQPVSEQAKWVGGQALATRAMRWGLFAAIGCGVVAFVLIVSGTVSGGSAPVKQRLAPSTDSAAEAAAGDLAEQFVLTWLQAKRGDEKALAPFVRSDGIRLPLEQTFIASDANISSLELVSTPAAAAAAASSPTTTSPSTTSAAGGSATQQKTYAVTVSVTVRGVQDAVTAANRRYFQVPVVVAGDSARAAAMPGEVAAPAAGADINLGYRFRVPSQQPIAVAVQQFLSALAAGSGDIARYTSPGTAVRPITPAPYTSVRLFDVAADHDFTSSAATSAPRDGNKVRILATAELAVGTESRSITGQYAVTMTARGGRWEVSALDPAPLLPSSTGQADKAITADSSTTSSSTPSSSTAVVSTPPASTTPTPN